MERTGDTRTIAPAFIYKGPWGAQLNIKGGLQAGNFVEGLVGANTSFYQNFGKFAYYVEGEYLYYGQNWETIRQRARGTLRSDLTLARLSEDIQLSLPVFASAAYDNILLLAPRVTAGGGVWLDYKPENGIFYNGLSVFVTGEWERWAGLPDDSAARTSVRNLSQLFLNDARNSYLLLDLFYTPNVVDIGDFRASTTLGVVFAVSDIINFSASGVFEYDSEPRTSALKNYDVGTMFGLGLNLENL